MKTVNRNGREFEHVTAPKTRTRMINAPVYGSLFDNYNSCSYEKIRVYEDWLLYAIETGLRCEVTSHNTFTFSLKLWNDKIVIIVTPNHNYIVYKDINE